MTGCALHQPCPSRVTPPQALSGLASSLEQLDLRTLPQLTPAALSVAHRLPKLSMLCVCVCAGLERAHTRSLAEELRLDDRDDVNVEFESVMVAAPTLADEFSELALEEDANAAAGPGAGRAGAGAWG